MSAIRPVKTQRGLAWESEYTMELCLNIRDYLEDPSRPILQQVDEAVEVARKATEWGYKAIYCPQHYVSHPTVWPQPMPVLARLMPEAPEVKLVTGILLLTYMNPLDVAEQVATQILTYCLDVGGSLTGEHGIGADKACHMPKMFTAADLETMQLVRAAFDPDQICNPDKLFPTPRLCGEVPGPYRAHPVEIAGLADRV